MPGRPGGRDRPETPPHSPQVARSRAGLYTRYPLMGEGRGGCRPRCPRRGVPRGGWSSGGSGRCEELDKQAHDGDRCSDGFPVAPEKFWAVRQHVEKSFIRMIHRKAESEGISITDVVNRAFRAFFSGAGEDTMGWYGLVASIALAVFTAWSAWADRKESHRIKTVLATILAVIAPMVVAYDGFRNSQEDARFQSDMRAQITDRRSQTADNRRRQLLLFHAVPL
jgi:hypothetical protein